MSAETQDIETIYDVDEADFERRVLERSRELPVVVDFWADWCGPCKQLTPVLERAATARAGRVELAKVDVEKNRSLQTAFRIQGIPAVKAFRDGRVAAEFTGALPPAQVESFFDSLVPSEADELAATGEEGDLRRALELEPNHPTARRDLGRLLLERGDRDGAVELLKGATGDFVADGLLAIGTGVVQAIGLIFGGISLGSSIFFGFLLVVVALGVLVLLGRRRQSRAAAARNAAR